MERKAAEEERQATARSGLRKAVDADDVDALRVAVKEGLAAGLGSEDLEEAMTALEICMNWAEGTCIRGLVALERDMAPHVGRIRRARDERRRV